MTNLIDNVDYKRIEQAIKYINNHFKQNPSLEEVASHVQLSPYHFQRLFTQWAGISPKKFNQYLSIEFAKGLLLNQKSLLETSLEAGLSSTSRLHDLFVSIEGVTPGEFKKRGANLQIYYSFIQTPFGQALVASTPKGVCFFSFEDNDRGALQSLMSKFPESACTEESRPLHQEILSNFYNPEQTSRSLKLHLVGTPFQLKVWEALLKIPFGELRTYQNISSHIGYHKAYRAVGSAIGSNPVAYIIPCHRVIRSTGEISGYLWGKDRKEAIVTWEKLRR